MSRNAFLNSRSEEKTFSLKICPPTIIITGEVIKAEYDAILTQWERENTNVYIFTWSTSWASAPIAKCKGVRLCWSREFTSTALSRRRLTTSALEYRAARWRGISSWSVLDSRGSQRQVSVDICLVEGGSPWKSALGFLSRKRSLKDLRWENDSPWGFQKGRTVCIWQSKTSARIFGKKIVTQKVSGKFISDGIFSTEDFRAILKFQLRNPNTYVDQIKMQTCSQKALSKHTNYTGYKLKLPLFTY